MLDFLFAVFDNKRLMAMIFAAIAAGATVITLAMPLLGGVPQAGKIRMAVRRARGRRGEIRFAVRRPRDAGGRIVEPLSEPDRRRAGQRSEHKSDHTSTPHTPSVGWPART